MVAPRESCSFRTLGHLSTSTSAMAVGRSGSSPLKRTSSAARRAAVPTSSVIRILGVERLPGLRAISQGGLHSGGSPQQSEPRTPPPILPAQGMRPSRHPGPSAAPAVRRIVQACQAACLAFWFACNRGERLRPHSSCAAIWSASTTVARGRRPWKPRWPGVVQRVSVAPGQLITRLADPDAAGHAPACGRTDEMRFPGLRPATRRR